MREIYFHRAIFLSWYCSKGDCSFCYMSTQKSRITNPGLARRTKESILAEACLCKLLNWKIEFLSGGYGAYKIDELVDIVKSVKELTGEKQWLNIGYMNESSLLKFKPYIKGISGSVETVNRELHKKVCPSKPLEAIEDLFLLAEKHSLKKSMTIILGLGEKIDDFNELKKFIKKYKIGQITFYRLKPQKGTAFENTTPITKEYYQEWIKLTREAFPRLHIIVGSWLTHLDEIHLLLNAGADGITKFPSIKKFNSKEAKKIISEVEKANCRFASNFTEKPTLKNLPKNLEKHLLQYISQMKGK